MLSRLSHGPDMVIFVDLWAANAKASNEYVPVVLRYLRAGTCLFFLGKIPYSYLPGTGTHAGIPM